MTLYKRQTTINQITRLPSGSDITMTSSNLQNKSQSDIKTDQTRIKKIQEEQKMKVLIADDDPGMRFLLTSTLKKWGYQVTSTDNGDEAWKLLNEKNPARIALLDWMMPGLDGIEICQNLQKYQDTPLIYTILITGKSIKDE